MSGVLFITTLMAMLKGTLVLVSYIKEWNIKKKLYYSILLAQHSAQDQTFKN